MLRSMGFDCSKENERLLHIYYMLRPSLVFLWVPWAGESRCFSRAFRVLPRRELWDCGCCTESYDGPELVRSTAQPG